ncbi:MAG: hypothetical protein IJH63_01280 [Methanobrevibacter sp.]|nr:hypothetical protein [Methanobrevibacter sp.]
MSLETLKNEIIKNEGLTINKELKNANLKNGFMVSIMGYEFITKDYNKMIDKIKEYKKILDNFNNDNHFIGVWIDKKDNDKIYIDISKNIPSRRDAEKTAKKNLQKAIYDIKHNRSIYLNYEITFYSLYKKILDSNNNIIDYMFIKQFDTKNAINILQWYLKNNYILFSDNININEL